MNTRVRFTSNNNSMDALIALLLIIVVVLLIGWGISLIDRKIKSIGAKDSQREIDITKIDITKQDIRCCDEVSVEEDGVNVEYELWFDAKSYFGTETHDKDSTWINFYTVWNPENGIRAEYFVEADDSSEHYSYDLTEKEKNFFFEKMEEYCQKTEKKSLWEIWDEYKNKIS